MATLTLGVSLFKSYDEGLITVDPSAINNVSGYIKVTFDSLTLTVKDVPSDGLPYNYIPAFISPSGDQVPNFSIVNDPLPGAYGTQNAVINHPCSKTPGTKTYKKKLMIYAVNSGKLDGNANNRPSSNGTTGTKVNVLARAILQKVPDWPCDDDVNATFTFTKTEVLS